MAMLLNSFSVTPSFLPTDITGLVAWWDAQDGATLDTDPVTNWLDKSVEGNNLNQGVSSRRPAIVSVSGKQMLEFDGVDEGFIIIGPDASLNFAGDFEFHVVYRTADTDRGELLAKGLAVRYHMRVNNGAPTDDLTVAIDDDVTAAVVLTDTSENWNDDSIRIVSMVRDGNTLRMFEDFNQIQTADITGYGSLSNAGNFFVGSFDLSVSFYDGEIGEITMYDNALSTGDRADLETYLKNKWGVS